MSTDCMELGGGKSTFELAPSPDFCTDRTIAVSALPHLVCSEHVGRTVGLCQYQ